MNVFALVLPLLFLAVFVVAAVKKVPVYDAFTTGVGRAIPFVVAIFPYIAAIFLLTELLDESGLSDGICSALSPVFGAVGVPKELVKLLLVKPFSGNGATAIFSEIVSRYGADHYLTRCAAVLYGSSETIFYIGAVYFANVKEKRLTRGVIISFISTLVSAVFGCFICRIL